MRNVKYFLICLLVLAALASCSDAAISPVITGDMNYVPEVADWMKGTWSGDVKEEGSEDDSTTVTMKEDGNGFNLTDSSKDFDEIKSTIKPSVVYSIDKCVINIDYTDTEEGVYKGSLTLTKKSDAEIELVLSYTQTKDGKSEDVTCTGTLKKN